MARIDSEIKEIRDTRSIIQTKLLTIEAVLEDHNLDFSSPAANSTPKKSTQNGLSASIDPEELKKQVQDEIKKVREEFKQQSGGGGNIENGKIKSLIFGVRIVLFPAPKSLQTDLFAVKNLLLSKYPLSGH